MATKVTEEDREVIEECLYAAHLAADQCLQKDRVMFEKLLDMSVSEALTFLQALKEDLQDDAKLESYKLHLFVPMQINELIKIRKEKKNAD